MNRVGKCLVDAAVSALLLEGAYKADEFARSDEGQEMIMKLNEVVPNRTEMFVKNCNELIDRSNDEIDAIKQIAYGRTSVVIDDTDVQAFRDTFKILSNRYSV